jgi:hypothetical protein
MSEILNLNAANPAAPAGARNTTWQKAGSPSGTDPTSGQPYFDTSTYIPDMVGDSGSGGSDGLAPAPAAGDAAANKFLKANGVWTVPPKALRVLGATIQAADVGKPQFITVFLNCTILSWTIIADAAGTASVDVWFIAGSAPPTAPNIPSSANKISASAPIALSSAQSAAGDATAISTWTKNLTKWGTLAFNLASIATSTKVTIQIQAQEI